MQEVLDLGALKTEKCYRIQLISFLRNTNTYTYLSLSSLDHLITSQTYSIKSNALAFTLTIAHCRLKTTHTITGLGYSRGLRLKEFLDNSRHMKVEGLSVLLPGDVPGTHLCYRLSTDYVNEKFQ
jgi:hypothetical protein